MENSKEFVETCRRKGLECSDDADGIRIISKYDRWLVKRENGKPALFHRNKSLNMYLYHVQGKAPRTFNGIMQYILNHDRYANHNIPVRDLHFMPIKPRKKKAVKAKSVYISENKGENLKKRKMEKIRLHELESDDES